MAANKIVFLGPYALAAAAADIISPPTVTGGTGVPATSTNTFYIIRHIRIVNKDSSTRTFSLYKGLTGGSAAGTEIIGTALSVAANSAFDWYGMIRISSGETNKFISGLASVVTTLVMNAEAEMGIE